MNSPFSITRTQLRTPFGVVKTITKRPDPFYYVTTGWYCGFEQLWRFRKLQAEAYDGAISRNA